METPRIKVMQRDVGRKKEQLKADRSNLRTAEVYSGANMGSAPLCVKITISPH